MEALLRQLAGLTRQQHVLMIFEDLHWADPSSRELLDLTVEQIGRLPVLLVTTFRPEFQPPWIGQPHVTIVSLRRLARDESNELIRGLVGSSTVLSGELLDEIIDRTDGVPLFLEELTKAVVERATAGTQIAGTPPTSLAVPATLQASLMARLDRLGSSAKEIAQIGAAIGREFTYELLAVVSQCAEVKLREAVGRLVDAGLVFQRGVLPKATFLFKHALVQDAAHGTLLRAPRRKLHAQIAKALETHFPELMDSQPELFAQHHAEAGFPKRSATYWGKAGHRSAARSAMAEAAAQFQKGLDQLALLPDDRERRRQELEFRSGLGAALVAAKGFAAPETGRAYARARELWDQLGSPSEFLQVPMGLARYHSQHGEIDLALRLEEDVLRLSRERSDPAGLILGHYSSGRDLSFAGKFASSRSHLEEAIALYDPISHCSLVYQTGLQPYVVSQAFLGLVLCCLGFLDRAMLQSSAAIAEARRLTHLPSLAACLALGTRLLSLDGDDATLHERAEQLMEVATEQGFPLWRAQGTVYRGYIKVRNGNVAEGISLLRSGLSAYRATGAEMWVPEQIALLATACAIAGQTEESQTLLDDALQTVERTGERWLEAELNRYKGHLLSV